MKVINQMNSKLITIVIVLISLANIIQAARYTVDAAEAGCNGHLTSLPGQGSGCGGSANLDKSEVEIATTLVNAGTPVEIFNNSQTMDQCCKPTQTYVTEAQSFSQNNSITITYIGSVGISAKDYIKAQVEGSSGTTNGATVAITLSAQTIAVPANSKKKFTVSLKKLTSKVWDSSVQYYCSYKVVRVLPEDPCGGYTKDQIFERAGLNSGSGTSTAVIWNSSTVYRVTNESCP